MAVDFSKMTQEDYELVLATRKNIDESIKKLSRIMIEIDSLEDDDESEYSVEYLKENTKKMLDAFKFFSEKLKPFEI